MKRIFLLLFALLLVPSPAAQAERQLTLLSDADDLTFVLDEHGDLFGEAGEYAHLTRLTPKGESPRYLAALSSDPEACFLLGAEGKALTEAAYTSLEYAGGYLVFWQAERCGVMSLDGAELTTPDYTWLMHIEDDRFFACKSDHLDDTADKLYLLSLSEGETDLNRYIGYGPEAGDGLYAAYDPRTQRFGYLDAGGEWAVEPRFDWAGAFEAGCAVAALEGALGLIDRTGEWIVQPQAEYTSLTALPGEGMLALAASAERICLFSTEDGALLREYGAGSVSVASSGFCALYLTDETLLLNPWGEEVCHFSADAVLDLTQGEEYFVRSEGAWGAARAWICRLSDGETLSGPHQQAELLSAQSDLFLISAFDTASSGEGAVLSEASGSRRWGVIDAQGREVLPLQYERIVALSKSLLALQENGQWTLFTLE